MTSYACASADRHPEVLNVSRDYSHALTISSSSDEELRTSGHLTLLPGGIVDEPSDFSVRLLIVRVVVRTFQQFTQFRRSLRYEVTL